MKTHILVGTVGGLWNLDRDGRSSTSEAHAGRTVNALAREGPRTWALVDGKSLCVSEGEGAWTTVVSIDGPPATCLAPTPVGLLIGTEEAHLWRLEGERLTAVASFETVQDRETWYTPWGDPADVRSIAAGPDAIHVNVHVGGVVRSRDGERSWSPTVDIETDVHQVIVQPDRPERVLVAAYDGLGISHDGGDTWAFVTEGMHAHYCRAVAIAGDVLLISASTGPGGKRSALYRRGLESSAEPERCRAGLPTWFDDNIDTGCLSASGRVVVAGTEDGRVFRSLDAGERWDLIAQGLPAVRCVVVE